jgi:hypothetical protein
MSPRSWWRTRPRPETGRSEAGPKAPDGGDASDPTVPGPLSGSVPAAGVPDDAQIARLRDLAAEGATGALHLNGRWGGTVYLLRGEIGHVESALTPGMEALLMRPFVTQERQWTEIVSTMRQGDLTAVRAAAQSQVRSGRVPDVHVELLRRSAMADAALAVLGTAGPEAARARSRFRPGERHWCVPGGTSTLADTLAEVARRRTVLARLTLGVRVYWPVARVPQLRSDRIRLTGAQWDVVRLADGVRSPLDIAWLQGHGVFATTVAVHQLARLGVVTVEAGDGAGAGQARPAPAGLPAAAPRHRISFLRAAVETHPATAGFEDRLERSRT